MIDEANLLVSRNLSETSDLMQFLVKKTKETNELSVLLISSDHALPFRFQDHFIFDLDDLRRTIIAGELPPDRMKSLLVDTWGMHADLADFCIGVYGGHIFDAYKALELLRGRHGRMSAFDVEPLDASMNIIRCLEAEGGKNNPSYRALKTTVPQITESEELAGLKDALRELAASGFVPIDDIDDDKARVLSKYNIAAVVKKTSFVFGLDESRWDETSENALVPSSQFMRMIIARVLDNSGRLEKTTEEERRAVDERNAVEVLLALVPTAGELSLSDEKLDNLALTKVYITRNDTEAVAEALQIAKIYENSSQDDEAKRKALDGLSRYAYARSMIEAK